MRNKASQLRRSMTDNDDTTKEEYRGLTKERQRCWMFCKKYPTNSNKQNAEWMREVRIHANKQKPQIGLVADFYRRNIMRRSDCSRIRFGFH